jgi:hypothetical protein
VQLANRPLRNLVVPGFRSLVEHHSFELKGTPAAACLSRD